MSYNKPQGTARSRIDKRNLKDRNGRWCLKYMQGGKVFERRLDEIVGAAGALSAARHKRDQLIAHVRLHGCLPAEGGVMAASGYSLGECLKMWISLRKPSMHVQYQRAADHLIESMGAAKDVGAITQVDVDGHCKRRAEKVRPQTYVLERRVLQRAIAYAHAYLPSKVPRPPSFYFDRVPYSKPGHTAGKEHSREAIEEFMGKLSPRLGRAMIFSFETGVRLHELMRLESAQVVSIDDPLFVAMLQIRPDQTKCVANARTVYLTQRAMIQAQWGISAGMRLLFDVGKSPSAAINRTNKRLGYPVGRYITMRDMRHYVGYTAERATGGTAAGMVLLGHKNAASHEHYRKRSGRHDLEAARAYHLARGAGTK